MTTSMKPRRSSLGANKKRTRNVKVAHNALDKELNMAEQYKKRYDCCTKDFVKIDKKGGSANKDKKKYVKLEFQTGMFEAMKKNMVWIMENKFDVKFVEDKTPKLETYGKSKAEERYSLDLMFLDAEVEYTVKLIIYNTNCTMGVDSVGDSAHTIIKNQTAAEYFVNFVLLETVDVIKNKIDVRKLNEQCRKLAMLGIESQDKQINKCHECKKEVENEKILKCKFCKKKIHDKCGEKLFEKEDFAQDI